LASARCTCRAHKNRPPSPERRGSRSARRLLKRRDMEQRAESRGSIGRRPNGLHVISNDSIWCWGVELRSPEVVLRYTVPGQEGLDFPQSASVEPRKDFPQVWPRCHPIHALHPASLAAFPAAPSLDALSAPARRLPEALSPPAPLPLAPEVLPLPPSPPGASFRLHVCFLCPPWQAAQ